MFSLYKIEESTNIDSTRPSFLDQNWSFRITSPPFQNLF